MKSPKRDPVNGWSRDPHLIQRARIVLAVSLSKMPPGELARIILSWLDDSEIQTFCMRYLDEEDLAFIVGP